MEEDFKMTDVVDDLLKRAGLWDVSEETRNNFRMKLLGQITDRLGIVALKHLDGKALAEFEHLSKKEELTQEKIMDFYNRHIDNFPKVMTQALIDFGKEFLETSKELTEDLDF